MQDLNLDLQGRWSMRLQVDRQNSRLGQLDLAIFDQLDWLWGVPRRQSHRRSGLANLPSVGAVP